MTMTPQKKEKMLMLKMKLVMMMVVMMRMRMTMRRATRRWPKVMPVRRRRIEEMMMPPMRARSRS